MRVAIIYPPIFKEGKGALLGQNRQFRYSSSSEVKIYPIVPSIAATLLKENGFEVLYLDGINEGLSMQEFLKRLFAFNPDLVMLETKTPVIKKHWKFINEIKKKDIKTVLVGDHVSWKPEESFKKSEVDYVIKGGDYDFALLNLCRNLEDGTPLKGGIFFRENGKVKASGETNFIKYLDSLPFIDRELTKWKIYGEAYLYKPCTYIMSGRGCGGFKGNIGKCSFCSWQHNLWNCSARLRSPENVAEEIEILLDKYNLKEIFDDNESGAIWNKKWLEKFYKEMKARGLIERAFISSNARADSLDKDTCKLLKKIGFRLLKVGLESGNDRTLKRINKKESIEKIKLGVKNAKDFGLRVMLTIMVGYPWETLEEVKNTYKIALELMLYKTGFGDSLQASVVVPYPGTPLYDEAIKNKWFIIDPEDYEKYDMSMPILKSPINAFLWCNKIWSIHKDLKFIFKSLFSIRSFKDLKLAYNGLKSLYGHKKDF